LGSAEPACQNATHATLLATTPSSSLSVRWETALTLVVSLWSSSWFILGPPLSNEFQLIEFL